MKRGWLSCELCTSELSQSARHMLMRSIAFLEIALSSAEKEAMWVLAVWLRTESNTSERNEREAKLKWGRASQKHKQKQAKHKKWHPLAQPSSRSPKPTSDKKRGCTDEGLHAHRTHTTRCMHIRTHTAPTCASDTYTIHSHLPRTHAYIHTRTPHAVRTHAHAPMHSLSCIQAHTSYAHAHTPHHMLTWVPLFREDEELLFLDHLGLARALWQFAWQRN